ncbi:MAG: bifunctional diaminohydroxyphosphoribosylaminopyrimidine deaminase/5-amino-6-(5-phosphoribosylamino)uracil reductase RibD [Pseudomonadota bacterium]
MSNDFPAEHPFAPFVRHALNLAERGRWHTAPNPTVGAVLVRDGIVVAEGWHKAYGGPHAEIECLRDAEAKGIDASQCTMVVTLEPCNHFGKTPPCSRAIEAAGIKHVVVGFADPNPVAQGGAAYLRSRGVTVDMPVLEADCRAQIADFLAWKMEYRPYLVLKLASTLDGRIATRTGHSQWISGPEARAKVHALRAHMGMARGAVLVGGQTLRDDNPQLTARLASSTQDGACCKQPLAIVVTQNLPTGPIKEMPYLIQERAHDCFFITSEEAAQSDAAKHLESLGVRIVAVPFASSADSTTVSPKSLDLGHALHLLHKEYGILYILCEGGGKLGLSLLSSSLVDEFQLHLAPKILGDNEARPLFTGRIPLTMADALGLEIKSMEPCGHDCIMTLRQAR